MDTAGAVDVRWTQAARTERRGRLTTSVGLLFAFWVFLVAWSAIDAELSQTLVRTPWVRWGVTGLFPAGLATWLWRVRRSAWPLVTSVPFGTALLVLLLAMTVLGTVVLQAPARDYAAHYPAWLAPVLLRLGLNDLFHTAWFAAFLALLAVSLVCVAVKRQAWKVPMWGHLCCHIGVVIVLLGGTVGRLLGQKAFLELREGQSASEALATGGGTAAQATIPLGFSVRLEDFAVDRYQEESRLVVYRIDGSSVRPVRSLDAERASGWCAVGTDGTELRVIGSKGPAAEIELRNGGQVSRRTLMAGSHDAVWVGDGKALVALERRPPEARAYRSRLAILENGRKVREKTIEVNDPLSWRGWHFYQSSYRDRDPTWSGIQVVRDPGFGIVFAGFAMIGLGVIFVYYVRPFILKRRAAA